MTSARTPLDEGAPLARQWASLLFSPAVFFLHLLVAYLLVPWSCTHQNELWLNLVSGAAVALSALGTFIAWQLWGELKRVPPGNEGGAVPRARFLAVTGFILSAAITLVLLSQWAAEFFLTACQ
jgi:hypothetical protein